MTVLRWLAALGLAAAFGVFDAHLAAGGVGHWFWVSQMSAFWLLLPFLAGALERSALGAALIGLAVTLAALLTFYVPDSYDLHQSLRVAHPYIVGGFVTGPLFGVFGYRWRRARSVLGALILSAAFCLEPLVWRHRLGFVPRPTYVWDLEVLTGLVLAACLTLSVLRRRSRTG
jgi:hypothetical protein